VLDKLHELNWPEIPHSIVSRLQEIMVQFPKRARDSFVPSIYLVGTRDSFLEMQCPKLTTHVRLVLRLRMTHKHTSLNLCSDRYYSKIMHHINKFVCNLKW
jgi:hypothetical protein